ncbi:hypothetical protein L5I01_29715 [Gordonia sp. HY442]|uniref:hypothetical protein n=1 Tax=Gordonia zhenghanii TaxID=2911516 RepID=UPI001F1D7256|nr:hypothetical protein [Gordonia zhenghanii]MCF8607542.1 hypothetical protein [Gordonia zhenghanii]
MSKSAQGLIHSVVAASARPDTDRPQVRVNLGGMILFLRLDSALTLAEQITASAKVIQARR